MGNALQAEFLKIRKRPATWVLFGLVIVDVLFWQYFLGYGTWLQIKGHVIAVPPAFAGPLNQPFSPLQVVRTVVSQVGDFGAIALILGALVAGSSYGWGTLKTELTAGEPRPSIVAAQFLVLAALFVPLVPILFAVAVALTFTLSSIEHFPMLWPPIWEFPAAMGAIYLNLVLYMAFGWMIAIVVRSAAFGIGLAMGYLYGFDLLALFGPAMQSSEQRWLPWPNAFSLVNDFRPLGGGPNEVLFGVPENAVTPALIAVAYTIVFLVLGAVVLIRRDVI